MLLFVDAQKEACLVSDPESQLCSSATPWPLLPDCSWQSDCYARALEFSLMPRGILHMHSLFTVSHPSGHFLALSKMEQHADIKCSFSRILVYVG